MLTYIILLCISASFPVQGLECYHWIKKECTAHNQSYINTCNQIAFNNLQLTTQKCHPTQDKCVLIASKFSFQDDYSVRYMVTTCGTGFLSGCNDLDELKAINPSLAQVDNFQGPGFNYESLNTCVCPSDYCVTFDQLSEFEERLFGNETIVDPRNGANSQFRPFVSTTFAGLVILFYLRFMD
ncbi:hypothetical protein BSL78_07304 [Apostichopus japonicus]|uniref:Uncharacterized protein n=1 Tax=Stichopus japonicus TaxID=307972 RepID=A0A2G8L6D0_STIJA|nr:hypothetical protein BSL78_07304 [Apostichopus japonicus]